MLSHGVRRAGPIGSVVAAAMLLAACAASPAAGPSGSPTASPSAAGSASVSGGPSTPSVSPTVPVADPSHAVPMPGHRQGPLASSDLLVWSQKSLDPTTIAQIAHTKGVTGVLPISLALVPVEDRLLKVAAVDPSTYRNYTPIQSADADEVWQRVAGGEVAIVPTRKKQLPPDAKGYVQMGSAKKAPLVHIGAYAPQVPGLVDAVVNEKWGAAMGMAKDNAVIVSTGTTSPDRVIKPITQLVGTSLTPQRLDVVARTGIDPKAPQTAYVVGTVADAVGHYTYRVLGGGRIAPDPAWVSSHIVQAQVPIFGTVTCNKVMIPQLRAALQEVVEQGLADKVHTYSGCYNPRFIAGTHSLSNHAFGLAIDIDASTNGRGTAGTMDRGIVRIFQKWGFTWGGTWHYTDPMHFELNRIVHPG